MDAHFGGLINLIEVLELVMLKGFVNIESSDEYGNNPATQ
jgi:hypothetical protein